MYAWLNMCRMLLSCIIKYFVDEDLAKKYSFQWYFASCLSCNDLSSQELDRSFLSLPDEDGSRLGAFNVGNGKDVKRATLNGGKHEKRLETNFDYKRWLAHYLKSPSGCALRKPRYLFRCKKMRHI